MTPFPLPLDVDCRIAVINWWLEDVDYRLFLGRTQEAVESFEIARDMYLNLPGGTAGGALEDRIIESQGKTRQTNSPNP